MFSGRHASSVTCGKFTPDGKTICTGSDDATLRIWNPKNGENIHVVRATAVMVTALEGHVEAFRLLVYVGADVKLSNKSGETAIGLSKLCPNCDLFEKVMLEFALEKGNHNGGEFHADDMNNPFSALQRSSSASNNNELKDELMRPDCIFPVPDHGLEHGYL